MVCAFCSTDCHGFLIFSNYGPWIAVLMVAMVPGWLLLWQLWSLGLLMAVRGSCGVWMVVLVVGMVLMVVFVLAMVSGWLLLW